MKKKIKLIIKLIVNLTINGIISKNMEKILVKYVNNLPMYIIINISLFITSFTLVDVFMYLIEMAYEHGDLSICEAAEAIENLMKFKKNV